MTDNLENKTEVLGAEDELKSKSARMSNEINTIVNQEMVKDKDYTINPGNIHVMPQKFLPESPQKSLGGKKKIILAAISFVIFLVIVIGVMLWIANRSLPQTPEQEADNSQPPENIEEPLILNHDEQISQDLEVLDRALGRYFDDFNNYPSSLSDLSSYLDNIPLNPDGGAYQYQALNNGNDFSIIVDFDGNNNNNRSGLYKLTKADLVVYNPDDDSSDDPSLPPIIPPPPPSPTSTPPIIPPPPPPPTSDNLDIDNDLLTQEEELVYNTDANDDDSDNDGFKDGSEIINLYDPMASGGNLINSGLITIFRDNDLNYKIFRPKNWLAQSLDNDTAISEIIFLSDSATGESISLLVFDNTETAFSLTEWSGQLDSGNWAGFTLSKTQNLSALKTTNGLKVLFVNNEYTYLIVHNIEDSATARFDSTFEMMVNSFELLNV